MAARASGVRVPASPGPIPTTASSPRGEPIEDASSGAGARATAQVPRTDLVLLDDELALRSRRRERPRPPPPRGSRPRRNTRSEGFRSRGASASRTGAGRNRAGHAERFGERVDRGLVRLEGDREHPGDRFGREPGRVEARAGEGRDLVRRPRPARSRCRARAGAGGRRGCPGSRRRLPSASSTRIDQLTGIVEGQAALRQPADPGGGRRPAVASAPCVACALDGIGDGEPAPGRPPESGGCAHPRAPEEGRDEGLAVLRVREGPPGGRLVESDAEAPVAGGGDRRGGADRIRDAPGQLDPAPVPPEERHRERPVVGDGDDRGLRPLVREGRCHRPHQDPGRADPYDGAPRLEEPADVAGRVREPHVGVAGPLPESVHLRAAEGVRYPARESAALRGDRNHRDTLLQLHAYPRRWTRTIEK